MSSPKSLRTAMRIQAREEALERVAKAIRDSGGYCEELVPGMLAKRLGISVSRLSKVLRQAGVTMPPPGKSWASMVGLPQPYECATCSPHGGRKLPRGGAA